MSGVPRPRSSLTFGGNNVEQRINEAPWTSIPNLFIIQANVKQAINKYLNDADLQRLRHVQVSGVGPRVYTAADDPRGIITSPRTR